MPAATPPRHAVLLLASLSALMAACTPKSNPEPAYIASPDEKFFDCIHTSISEWRCPDTTGPGEFSAASIASAAVTITLTDGRVITRTLPANTDALFFTRGATRTFLVRYYKATDPKKAGELEQRLLADPQQK